MKTIANVVTDLVNAMARAVPDAVADITLDRDTYDELIGLMMQGAYSDEQKRNCAEADVHGVISLKQIVLKRGPKIYHDNIVPISQGKKK